MDGRTVSNLWLGGGNKEVEGLWGKAVALRTFCVNGDCGQNLRRVGDLAKRTSGKRQNQPGVRLEEGQARGGLCFSHR